ncbi:phospholipid carrier-dependent glycosyltransferase [Pseudomonas citronellolis]|uniref:phospholipid carrier-dependent glycosyltransferase n=1 Tax=Pseudomonas citronellolis TaxID=53408 RepID=UPI0023E3F33D|nr:glycosyltransferase family 39 protein [Pseudomonas citronellolis]MDF3936202.1 glycosyltransferase family 39 protein [Pseudomonas citronellolis]
MPPFTSLSTLSPRLARLSPAARAWLLGAFALALFCLQAQGRAVIGFDSRFVLFAQEMLRHGPSLFPTTYGEPYPDYPGTSTLLIYLLSLPFGRVDNLAAWLPTALAGTAVLVLVYRLLEPISSRWALLAVAMLLLTVTFVSETRAVSLDQMVAALALGAFYRAYNDRERPLARTLGWQVALLLAGFLVRGPLGLVIPAAVVCACHLAADDWRRLLGFGLCAGTLLVLCCLALLGLAEHSGGAAFAREVLQMQVVGRLDGSAGSSSPLYYFLSAPGNYALAFPLALPALALAFGRPGRAEPTATRILLRACVLAALLVMIGLSVPQAKKARYILAMAPFAAILAAYPFQVAGNRLAGLLRGILQGLWLALPGVLCLALLVARRRFPELASDYAPELYRSLALLLALQALALFFAWRPRQRALGLAACAALSMWAAYILAFEPIERGLYDTRGFTLAADAVMAAKPAPVAFVGLGRDAKAIKYLVNLDHDLAPRFIDDPGQLDGLRGPAYLVMEAARQRALGDSPVERLRPLVAAEFDREPFVLLYLPADPSLAGDR